MPFYRTFLLVQQQFELRLRLTLGAAPVLALRVSFTGELGYELHVPSEFAVHVYRLIMEAGRDLGIVNAGYRALNSLRMEKGFVLWGSDITPDYTPHHAGLSRLVSRKKGNFIGKEAIEWVGHSGADRLLCVFMLNEKVPVFGGEAILRAQRQTTHTARPASTRAAGRASRISPIGQSTDCTDYTDYVVRIPPHTKFG